MFLYAMNKAQPGSCCCISLLLAACHRALID